jgi:hypothetical protein
MALDIETFSNATGGNAFFKAIGHPLALPKADALLAALAARGPVVAGVYVQKIEHIARSKLGHPAQPVTELPASRASSLLVVAFDAGRLIEQIKALLPPGCEASSLDAMKLPPEMLTNRARYLDPLNFATNFAFFRDADGQHTRLTTVNYWAGYGAKSVALWCRLFGLAGETLAEWREQLPDAMAAVEIDSRTLRARFGLAPFTGQLFLHAIGVTGHDVVKYALDTYGDDARLLSCTHDANAWPADLYAGLPAPRPDERVILWVQNSHPCAIPPRGVGLNLMGSPDTAWLERKLPPFGSYALDVAELLPTARWPQQIEVTAGKHFVRPRYEVVQADGRSRIAHANVERTDLSPDPRIAELGNLLGKGFILPAPLLPSAQYRSTVLPTPMATSQETLPLALVVYDAEGREHGRRHLGCLKRSDSLAVDPSELVNGGLEGGYGHVELVYDFAAGGEADGWLHGIFRYEDRASGHGAETSFGAHVFNTVLTYRNEPQSYAGPAPGLTTRLFLRLGPEPLDTLCHLIYPASAPWHAHSATDLVLHDGEGREVARRRLEIPCSGSRLWHYHALFTPEERARTGGHGYLLVRDGSCRLFGYHGLLGGEGAFSLDHMFGF